MEHMTKATSGQEASRTKNQVPNQAEKVWREPAIHCVLGVVLFQTTLSDRNYYSANEKAEVQKG